MGSKSPLGLALESFELAPFEDGRWQEAVAHVAAATGSRAGQLVSWSGPREVPGYVVSELNDGTVERWVEMGGADPALNPIIAAGLEVAPLTPLSDEAFMSDEERRKNPLWPEFYDLIDLPRICIGTAWRSPAGQVVLAALRTRRQGAIAHEELDAFDALLTAAGRAISIASSLKREAARIAAGALELVEAQAFILDGFGRVIASTASAEASLRRGDPLQLRKGKLHACAIAADLKLQALIAQALAQPAPERVQLQLPACDGRTLIVEAMRIADGALAMGLAARATVVVKEAARPAPDLASELRRRYGLTVAEAEVAMALLEGHSPKEAAALRSASLQTVRTQVRSIYAKCGVRSHLGLAALARQIG